MIIFEIVQRYYGALGICPSHQSTSKFPFNERVFAGFLIFGSCIVLHAMYIVHVANDFIEYVECSCSLSATIIIFVCFLAAVFKRTELFESINNTKELIESSKNGFQIRFSCVYDFLRFENLFTPESKHSKSRILFLKTIHQVEQMSEIVFMVVVKVALQLVMLPKSIASYSIYFFSDLGDDPFQIPVPLW